MARYEDEDGGPRYGQRLSPEELAAYLREQEEASQADRPGRADRPDRAGRAGRPHAVDGGRTEDDPYARRVDASPASPAPTAPAAPPVSGASPGRRRRRWRTLVVGLLLLLLIPGVMTVSAVTMVLDGSLAGGAVLAEDGTVYLEKGTTSALYSAKVSASTQDCTVTGPDGAELVVDRSVEGASYASFTASQTGTHTVTCPQGTAEVVIGPPMNLSRVPLASMLVMGAVVIGLAGLVVTVIGIMRLRR